jgi:hypothetical protein
MPHRSQTKSTHALAGAQGLVEIEPWDGNTEYISEAFAAELAKDEKQTARRKAPALEPAK